MKRAFRFSTHSGRLVGGAKGGGIEALSKLFSKLLQNWRVLSFSKQNFGGFLGLQEVTRFPNVL
jgi:hypothetical protein